MVTTTRHRSAILNKTETPNQENKNDFGSVLKSNKKRKAKDMEAKDVEAKVENTTETSLESKVAVESSTENVKVAVRTQRRKITARSETNNQPKGKSGPTRTMEKDLWKQGYWAVGGADEAGRGPLAGPVVAAVCVMARRQRPDGAPEEDSEDVEFPKGVADSKQLTEEQREALYEEITNHKHIRWAVSVKSREEIDQLNILNASLQAMADAAAEVADAAAPGGLDYLLVDGNKLPKGLSIPATAVVKGDATCACIAAASIIAKVTRDRLMDQLDEQYPKYGFKTHKGYGVPAHLAALREHGPCVEHRLSYNPVRSWVGFTRDAATGEISIARALDEISPSSIATLAFTKEVAKDRRGKGTRAGSEDEDEKAALARGRTPRRARAVKSATKKKEELEDTETEGVEEEEGEDKEEEKEGKEGKERKKQTRKPRVAANKTGSQFGRRATTRATATQRKGMRENGEEKAVVEVAIERTEGSASDISRS